MTVASRTFFDHTRAMSKDVVSPYKMNLPADLKNRLQEAAERSGRSLSSEIITRLQASLSLADDNGLDFTYKALERMILEIVANGTEELEGRVSVLERFMAGKDPYNPD